MGPDLAERWSVSGRWIFPVGDPLAFRRPGPDGDPGYVVTRNVRGARGERHQGADLSCRQAGGRVRASSHGVVVLASDAGNGYGLHVVVAHRQPDGSLVFSVYAHLAAGSLRVSAGERITMGQDLGRVGRTGDASAPHLHFEIRRPADPGRRWEKAEAIDPIAFVTARLPTRDRDSSWARPYLAWAEGAGLIRPQDEADAPLSRDRWRRALALAQCPTGELGTGPPVPPDLDPETDAPSKSNLDLLDPIAWPELMNDLSRARARGLCLPADTTRESVRQEHCKARLDEKRPGSLPQALKRRKGQPTLAEITLLLADLAAR